MKIFFLMLISYSGLALADQSCSTSMCTWDFIAKAAVVIAAITPLFWKIYQPSAEKLGYFVTGLSMLAGLIYLSLF